MPCQPSISAGKASKKQAFESFLAFLASYQQHGWLSILRAPASTDVMIGTDVNALISASRPVLFPALKRKFSSLLFVPYLKHREGEESTLGADVTAFFLHNTLQHFPRLHRVREAQTTLPFLRYAQGQRFISSRFRPTSKCTGLTPAAESSGMKCQCNYARFPFSEASPVCKSSQSYLMTI